VNVNQSHVRDLAAEPVVLSDGRAAIVRLLDLSDRPALQTLFDSLSEEHLYTRFFSLGHGMVSRHLDHLFAGGATVVTYVVEVQGRVVGVSDVEHLSATTAEVAFLVADDMHGRGVATLLLERATRDAHDAGIEWFTADVLAMNHEMLEVFTDIGFTVDLALEGADVTVRMSTAPTIASGVAERSRR